MPGERFFRAYQWHPERLFSKDKDNREIFIEFIEASRKKHKTKKDTIK